MRTRLKDHKLQGGEDHRSRLLLPLVCRPWISVMSYQKVYGWKAGLRTRIQMPVITLYLSGLAGSEICTNISGISTIYVRNLRLKGTGYYRWRAAGRVLCRSKMQQRHRVARPRVSVTVSEPDIGTYIRLVPIASQRVCLVYLLSQVLKGSITHDSKKKSPTRNMNSSLFKKGSKRPRSEAARKWDSEFRESYRENRFRTNMSPLARNPSIRFPWAATRYTIPDQISQHCR